MEGTSRTGSTEEYSVPDMSLSLCNSAEDANDSKLEGSENYEIADDEEPKDEAAAGERSSKRVKYHRHTPEQITELENFFKECPHPNENQRLDLSNKLGMETRQVKFWFQNRRTQQKAQKERNAISALVDENEKLRMGALAMKVALGKAKCKECGASSSAEMPANDLQLRMENARLKKDLIHACGMLKNLIGKPGSNDMVHSFSQLGLSLGGSSSTGGVTPHNVIAPASSSSSLGIITREYQNSVYLHIAAAAMHEVVVLAHKDSPFWLKNLDGERETLNKEEYEINSGRIGPNPSEFVSEATRATGSVVFTSLELINILMHPIRWAKMFPCMIGKVSVIEVLCSGVAGTHDGELLMMNAELLFPSPLVPRRQIRFIRYCKKHSDGTWAVVDISVDPIREDYADVYKRCRKLPSGCIIEDLPKGNSMVTFVEHDEYDESIVHRMFRPVMRSGSCYGAERWLATMQRQCERYAFLATPRLCPPDFPIGITVEGRGSIVKLMERAVDSFCYGTCASTLHKWDKLCLENIPPETQVMTRVNVTNPGELPGIILSLSTCVWLPIARQWIFNFLRDPRTRSQWDLLANEGPMQHTVQIHSSPNFSDCISLLFPPPNPNQMVNNVVLQHTWADKVISAVVFASVNLASISGVMGGEDSDSVKMLPSGFVITDSILEGTDFEGAETRNGSLLTIGIQILMNAPAAMITMGSIQTLNVVMNSTIQRIRAALVGGEVVG